MTARFSARGPVLTGIATLAVLTGSLGLWSVTARLTGAVVAFGQIGLDGERRVVQHPDGGVVAEIRVAEGSRVTAGQILLRLDGSALAGELSLLDRQRRDLAVRRARLEAERDGAPAIRVPATLAADPAAAPAIEAQGRFFAARVETAARQTDILSRRADQTRRQIEGMEVQAKALADELRLLRQERATVATLVARGLAEVGRLRALEREEARLTGAAGELAADCAAAQARVAEIEGEVLRLDAARREAAHAELRDLAPQDMALEARRAALAERLARLDITAPVAGVVLGLAVTAPRAVLRPAETALTIVPQDRQMAASVRIPLRQVGEVHPGQRVTLVIPGNGLPPAPPLQGVVLSLSADTLTDDRTGLPYYRADIAVLPGTVGAGDTGALYPGMPVEAFIRTGDYTPLSYLLQPLADHFGRAMRDG